MVADEINKLSLESADATQKIEAILKDILNTVDHTSNVIDLNNTIVRESNDQLEETVQIFHNISSSSEDVVKVSSVLEAELKNILAIKEKILEYIHKITSMSETSMESAVGIGKSTEEQAMAAEEVMKAMENVQREMHQLGKLLE